MDKIIGSMVGHAIGSAMGRPGIGKEREELYKKPIKKYMNTSFGAKDAGCWTEPTALTLATMDSYIENEAFIARDMMDKFTEYENGSYVPEKGMPEVSETIEKALDNYNKQDIQPTKCGIAEDDCTALGRMLPFAVYCYNRNMPEEDVATLVEKVTSLTNKNETTNLGCYIYINYLMRLFDGEKKKEAYDELKTVDYSMYSPEVLNKYHRILGGDISNLSATDIKTDNTTVDTLEAALFVHLVSDTFSEGIVGSINLGGETDTLGAVTGSLMSANDIGIDMIPDDMYYGLKGIDAVEELTEKFVNTLEEVKAKKR